MGRPFLEKFADVQWEVSEENLQAWKDGKTGYPIVDAGMRACKARGRLTPTHSGRRCRADIRLDGEPVTDGDSLFLG
jgi:deoxyribodipyrimidine photolyase